MPDLFNDVPGAAAETASAWLKLFLDPLQDLASQILGFLPQLISAIIILIVGSIIVRIIVGILGKVLSKAGIDKVFDKVGLTKELSSVGITASFSDIITGAIKIFLKLIVWMAVINTLKIDQLTAFIGDVVNYVPNVIVAIIILAAGLAVANVAEGLTKTAAGSIAGSNAKTLASIVKISIIVFTGMAVLQQIHIAGPLINTLFAGIIGALSIGAGIAFGLGGQDKAKEVIAKVCK